MKIRLRGWHKLDKVADIAGGIIVVALVTTVVSHKQSAKVITAIGNTFSGSLRAAMGK